MFYELTMLQKLLVYLITIFIYTIAITTVVNVVLKSCKTIERKKIVCSYRKNSMFLSNYIEIPKESPIDDIVEIMQHHQMIKDRILQRQQETVKDPIFIIDSHVQTILDIVKNTTNINLHHNRNIVIEILSQINLIDKDYNVFDDYPEVHRFIFHRLMSA